MNLLKIVIIFVIISMFCGHIVNAQTLRFVAERKVENMNFINARQIKISLSKGKAIGTYLAIPLIDEIDAILKQNSALHKASKVIIAAISNTDTNYYTYREFDNNVTMLPPYLISQEKISSKLYDTVYYQDKGDANTVDMDMAGLNRQVFGTTITNVRLQFNSINVALKEKIFGGFGLLFPVDKSPNRWAGNIKSIKVFVIE